MIESNDDIFKHIKSVMRDHEEPYDEGAWERFKAMQAPAPVKKGSIGMWKWAMAAAAAIAAVFVLSRIFDASNPAINTTPEVATVTMPPVDSSHTRTGNADIGNQKAPGIAPEIAGIADDYNNGKNAILESHSSTPSKSDLNLVAQIQDPVGAGKPPIVILAPEPIRQSPAQIAVNELPKKPEVDFWRNKVETNTPPVRDNKPAYQEPVKQLAVTRPDVTSQPRKEKSNKWQPSLYVSPLFGDLGVDMGYGVSVGYAINDKIKISSGIAYNKLSASRNYGAGPAGGIMASAPVSGPSGPQGAIGATGATGAAGSAGSSSARPSLDSKAALTAAYNFVAGPQTNSLQQVDGSLSGFDIPVEINYNISKKLYASAGISGLVVINDNKKYTYIDNRNVQVSVETNRGTLKEDKSVTFSEQNTTTQPVQAPTENIPFLGFYNISMGYRQKISGRTGVALEPFLKVPMRNVTQENLKYIGTGIRLKVDL